MFRPNKFLFALILVFLPFCHGVRETTVSGLDPLINNVIEQAEGAKTEKDLALASKNMVPVLRSCQIENKNLRIELNKFAVLENDLRGEISKLKNELKKVSRDAGQGDTYGDIGRFVGFAAVAVLLFYVLFLIGKGKIRIPGVVG